MSSQSDLSRFREIISSQPEEDRKQFVESFSKLSEEKKEIAIQRTLEQAPQREKEPAIEPAKKFLGSQTLGNIGMTMATQGASARGAIRANKFLAPAGALAGLLAQTGVAGEEAKQAAISGFQQPSKVETFREQSVRTPIKTISQPTGNKLLDAIPIIESQARGQVRDIAGFAADIGTDATSLILMLIGKAPGMSQAMGKLGATKPAKAIIKELKKPRAIRAPRIVRKFLRRAKTPSGQVLTTRVKETSEATLSRLAKRKGVALNKIEGEEKLANATAKEAVALNEKYSKQVLKQTKDTMDDNVTALTKELQIEAETGAARIQKELPRFYKENSKGYGQVLDDITDDLVKANEQITVGEVNNIIKNSIKEMDDALITEGGARNAVNALSDKYSALGPDDVIEFKAIVNDLRNVKSSITSGAKSGASRFTSEDLAASILDKNLGTHLKVRVPEFAKLQETYGPIMETMKKSNTIFKPFKGKYDTRQGANILKASGSGKFTQASPEEQLLQALEKGTPFSKGIGDVRVPITQKGKELFETKNAITGVVDDMKSGAILRKENIDKNLAIRLDKLGKSKDFINSTFARKEELIKQAVGSRLKQIGLREEQIKNLLTDKAKFQKLLFKLGAVSAAIYGAKRTIDYLTPKN